MKSTLRLLVIPALALSLGACDLFAPAEVSEATPAGADEAPAASADTADLETITLDVFGMG